VTTVAAVTEEDADEPEEEGRPHSPKSDFEDVEDDACVKARVNNIIPNKANNNIGGVVPSVLRKK